MRLLSTLAARASNAQETGEVFLLLLTVTPSAGPVLRFVNDIRAEPLRSRGQDHVAWPFDVVLPDEDPDATPRVSLAIDLIDSSILAAVQAQTGRLEVVLELVIAAAPSTVVAGPFVFGVDEARWTNATVTFALSYQDLLNEAFPAGRYLPGDYPGVFE